MAGARQGRGLSKLSARSRHTEWAGSEAMAFTQCYVLFRLQPREEARTADDTKGTSVLVAATRFPRLVLDSAPRLPMAAQEPRARFGDEALADA